MSLNFPFPGYFLLYINRRLDALLHLKADKQLVVYQQMKGGWIY